MISLERIIEEQQPSIICITETHLDEDEELEIKGYTIKRKDRNKDGGGCLIAYKLGMKNLVTEVEEDRGIEAKWIRVENSVGVLKIGVVYCPQENAHKKDIEMVYERLEEEIKQESEKQNTLLCGDFNAKIFKEEVKGSGIIMKEFMRRNNMVAVNEGSKCKGKWTRVEGDTKSIIDYVLTKDSDAVIREMIIDEEKEFSVYHRTDGETTYSDHNSIIIHLDWKAMIRQISDERKIKVMTEQGRENYRQELNKMKPSEWINEDNDIDEEYEKWTSAVKETYDKQLKSVTKKNEWKVNRLLMNQIKCLKKARRQESSEIEVKLINTRIELLREHCDKEIMARNARKIKNLVDNITKTGKTDLTAFYKFNRKKKDSGSVTSLVTTEDGRKTESREESIAEYEKHYSSLLEIRPAETQQEKDNELLVHRMIDSLIRATDNQNHRTTTAEEVEMAIKTIKRRKAADATGWRNELMMDGGEEVCKGLAKLFSMTDKKKTPPKQWENMKIKAVFKEGIRKASNTRGLFITSVVSKVKEKTMKNRNEITSSPFQCGGKKGVAPIDHTLVMLEMIKRNKYLGCDTYLVFIDMKKCFDKLWLEDGVIELWRGGMDEVDARMILEMNRRARAIIETPYGNTKEIILNKVCKQGTVFAVVIGCKVMERVNGIGERAVTCFGPRLRIESLTYVDDIAGGGKKETIETTVSNCGVLEEKKKASVNLEKSKWMKIGKGETAEIKTEVKDGKLGEVKEYKHLGTWINNKGDSKTNIQKRKNKGEGAYKKINEMTLPSRVGKQEIPLKLTVLNRLSTNSIVQ